MSTDPFNIVKEELKKTVNKTKSLIESFNVLSNGKGSSNIYDDPTRVKLLADIRTNLKSINWDIQDLDETIKIASKNPAKFNLSNNDIETRRQFITHTRDFVQKTKQNFNIDFEESIPSSLPKNTEPKKVTNINIRIPDLISNAANKSKNYTRLNDKDEDESDYEIDTRKLTSSSRDSKPKHQQNQQTTIQLQHEDVFREQDRNLELIGGRVGNLKNISQAMQNELDSQANLLDDLGREMETTDSKMQTVMKKITKVMHMSSDKRQWTMIAVLLGAIVFIIFLFAIL